MPEGTSLTILERAWTASGPTATTDVDLTELVTGLEPRSNGYRLSIAVSVDGTAIGAKQLWLACGAPQDGHPNRILFEVRWLDVDGQPFAPPLDTAMAPGWRDSYAIEAASIRGTARCTIPAGTEQLVCDYDNPDHGSKPGLVVPGGRHHTYDVAQLGLPGRWVVDASTVGTFVGRDTCGTGGCGGDDCSGGHEGDTGGCDGHEDGGREEAAASMDVAADETTSVCTHTVVNRYLGPPPPTTTTTTTPTTTTTTTPTSTTTTSPAAVPTTDPPSILPGDATAPAPPVTAPLGPISLPRTGGPTAGLALLGAALVLTGSAMRVRDRTARDGPTEERR